MQPFMDFRNMKDGIKLPGGVPNLTERSQGFMPYFIRGAGLTNPAIGVAGNVLGLSSNKNDEKKPDMSTDTGNNNAGNSGQSGLIGVADPYSGYFSKMNASDKTGYHIGLTARNLLQINSQRKFNNLMADANLDPETRYSEIKKLENFFTTKDELLANSPYANLHGAVSKDGKYSYDPFRQQWAEIPQNQRIPAPPGQEKKSYQHVRGGDGYYYLFDPSTGEMKRTNIPHDEAVAQDQQASRDEINQAARNALDPNFQIADETPTRTIETDLNDMPVKQEIPQNIFGKSRNPEVYNKNTRERISGEQGSAGRALMQARADEFIEQSTDTGEQQPPETAQSPTSQKPIYARHKKTGHRIISNDGGRSWQDADKEALQWAKQNPEDPRAKRIMELLGAN